jgi:2-dehydro-3-deoxygluconokinase
VPDIVVMGEPLVEFNEGAGDGLFRLGFGGDVSNCAIAASRAGASAGIVSAVGADAFGDWLFRLWAEEEVDASHVARSEDAPTGLYFVSHGRDGHTFSYRRKGSAASLLAPRDVPVGYITRAKVLHLSGISLAISDSACDCAFSAIEAARGGGALVSFDPNLRLKLWPLARARAVIHAAMALCDIALPGVEDAKLLTGLDEPDAIADFYLKLGARIVALTLGPAGCLVATGSERRRVPGLRVEAVDATGAGDAFDGNFLAEYLRAGAAFEAARFANAAAALSTTGYGAVAPLPRRSAVMQALAEADAAG